MVIEQIKKNSGTLLLIKGNIDYKDTADFKNELKKIALESSGSIDVDLSEVTYLDSSGIGALLVLWKLLKKSSREFHIVNCSKSVQNIIELTSLSDLLM